MESASWDSREAIREEVSLRGGGSREVRRYSRKEGVESKPRRVEMAVRVLGGGGKEGGRQVSDRSERSRSCRAHFVSSKASFFARVPCRFLSLTCTDKREGVRVSLRSTRDRKRRRESGGVVKEGEEADLLLESCKNESTHNESANLPSEENSRQDESTHSHTPSSKSC